MPIYQIIIYLNAKDFQDIKLQNLESMNELDKKSYVFQTQFVTLGKLAYILSVLRNQKVGRIRASVACPDEDFISELNQTLKKRRSNLLENRHTPILGKKVQSLQAARKGRYQLVIDLHNKTIAVVFVNEYRSKLTDLGQEFNISMVWEGNLIKVYSENPISTLFESQIMDMKHKLKWIIDINEEFFRKLKISKQINQIMSSLKIKIVFLSKLSRVLLHSSEASIQDLKQVVMRFSYDAVIIKFDIDIYSKMVNRIYFRMIIYHCEPKLIQISENFQIKHQINTRRLGIILHTQDPIFSRQPKQMLKQFLQKVVFITYYTKNPTNHILHFRKNKPKSNCLQVMMSDIFVYTSWNGNKTIEPEEIVKSFQPFLLQLTGNAILRIAIKTGGLNPTAIDKVEFLADKYKLLCQPPNHADKSYQILHVKFKSFNPQQKSAKISQMCEFLIQLITGKCNEKPIRLPQKVETEENIKNQNMSSSISEENSIQKSMQSNSIAVTESRQEGVQEQGLEFEYVQPEFVMSQQKGLKNGKRNKKLQQLLYQKYNMSARVWDLMIQSNLYKPKKESVFARCRLYPIEEFEFQQEYKLKKPVTLKYSDLRNGQSYYLISKTEGTDLFELSHKMIVYDN